MTQNALRLGGAILALLAAFSLTGCQAAAELIDLANQNGGRDNISVILVRVPPEFLPSSGWAQRFLARKKGN